VATANSRSCKSRSASTASSFAEPLFKFYFSVSKKEQLRRFKSRHGDLLKQYKISPVDEQAQKLWDQYTVRKFQIG